MDTIELGRDYTFALGWLSDLPEHEAGRWENRDGLSTKGDLTNGECASEAERYAPVLAVADEEAHFSDLITGMLHLAHSRGMDLGAIVRGALHCFEAEAGPLLPTPLQRAKAKLEAHRFDLGCLSAEERAILNQP